MARRDALCAAGGYRPAFAASEDYDLWLRLADCAGLANLPDVALSLPAPRRIERFCTGSSRRCCASSRPRRRRGCAGRGERDPSRRAARSTRATLRGSASRESEIETRTWRRALGVARQMRRLGDAATAARLVALARRHRPGGRDLAGSLRFAYGVARSYL